MCSPPLMVDGTIEIEEKSKKICTASLTLYGYAGALLLGSEP